MQHRDAGAFALTDIDADAAALTARWDQRWPGAQPSGPSLRAACPDRWVRLYTLPQGRRPARTPAERAEVHGRIAAVRAALADGHAPLVVGEDWDAADGVGGWTQRLLPAARPWRIATLGDAPSYFWVTTGADLGPLVDAVIDAVIDDRAAVVLADPSLGWVLAPYDGGIDVFSSDVAARDALARRFASWASPRADGR